MSAPEPAEKLTVVIHTNEQQHLAALVAAHSLKSRSIYPDRFEVHIMRMEETPALYNRQRQRYFWWNETRPSLWRRSDLLSFQPLRFMVPALLGFSGRALVIDPDVFAVGDVYELLSRDMNGKAVLCRERPSRGPGGAMFSSAVMLLDCNALTSWDPDRLLDAVFSGELKMGPWLALQEVPAEQIGLFEDEWNDLDHLTAATKLLHNTEVSTQPWRTGLWADYRRHAPRIPSWLAWIRLHVTFLLTLGRRRPMRHRAHPDARQERMFITLLNECMQEGTITKEHLRSEVRKKHVRRDMFKLLEQLRAESTAEASGVAGIA